MRIGDKKRLFTKLIAALINRAYELGYEISFAPEHSNHIENSNHFKGLAKDFNLYKDGTWLNKTEQYTEIGEYWEGLHSLCRWGGRFNDGCHFSFMDRGVS